RPHAGLSGYICQWLGGYSGGLESIAGVLIADYWLFRRKQLELAGLYKVQGAYTYSGGWNWRAVAATLIGCALAWGGLVIPFMRPLYDYAWFVGFLASGAVYLALMKGAPAAYASGSLEANAEADGD